MLLVITLVLALVPLLGIVLMFVSAPSLTVDNLFMALILLAMSGIMMLNVLLEMFNRKTSAGGTRSIGAHPVARSMSGAGTERGRVENVQFYESNVGVSNKSLVTLSDGAKASRLLLFSGDMRNSLPVGKKVAVAFRESDGGKVLLNVDYF